MKISYCFSNLLMGGVQVHLCDLMEAFKDQHETTYSVLNKENADPLIVKRLEPFTQETPEKTHSADVIYLDGINFKEQKKQFKKVWEKTIQHIGSAKKTIRWWNRRQFSPNIVAVSHAVAEGIKNCTVIHCGADTTLFSPTNVKKKYDILFLGRLREIKNPGLFLEIAKQGNFSFIVIGGTHTRMHGHMNKYETLAREQATTGRDLVTGFIAHQSLPAYINQARVCVVTSHSEGLGKNALECMACGLPVVARNSGGLAEALQDLPELLVPYNAPVATYIKKINYCLANAEIGVRARKNVEKNFSLQKTIQLHEQLYNRIASQKKK